MSTRTEPNDWSSRDTDRATRGSWSDWNEWLGRCRTTNINSSDYYSVVMHQLPVSEVFV